MGFQSSTPPPPPGLGVLVLVIQCAGAVCVCEGPTAPYQHPLPLQSKPILLCLIEEPMEASDSFPNRAIL